VVALLLVGLVAPAGVAGARAATDPAPVDVDPEVIDALAPLGLDIDPATATALVGVDADDVVVDVGDHHYAVLLDGTPDASSAPAESRQARSALGGYTLALADEGIDIGINSSYRLRLVNDHASYLAVAAEVSSVAAELAYVTGASITTGASVAIHTFAEGDITVQVGTSSPCGTMTNPGVIGCGGFTAVGGRIVTGQVYLCSCMLGDPDMHELVMHETAHALGLGHYDSNWEGQLQVMRSVGPVGASFYRSGDVNGLRKVTANGFGGGTAPNHPPSATSTPSVSGSFATLHASWAAASAYGRSITSHQIQARHTGSGATKTVTVGSSLSGSVELVGGHTYQARVRARNALGWGPWSPWSASTYVTGRCMASISDVSETSTFCPEITWLIDQGVATGFPDGTFRPGAAVTRQAMAAFLRRHAERLDPGSTTPTGGGPTFSDVDGSHPFSDDITWLAEVGITTGYPDGTFRPARPISRQAMAAMVQRFTEWLDPLAEAPTGPATPFSDVGVDHPFVEEIAWLAATGLSSGFPDGTFRPDDPITRQAMAAFLFRHDETFG
jgi:hypothetical protein